MNATHKFRFVDGIREHSPFDLTFDEARIKALELAKSSGLPQTMFCFNIDSHRWHRLGTYYPEGFILDNLNWVNVMNDTNNGLFVIGKLGEEYTREYVLSRQNSHAHIINAAQNKIEYDNGLIFVYNFQTQTYHLSVKKGGTK